MKEKILVFGTGTGAQNVMKTVGDEGAIIGFVDNNKERQGLLFFDKLVYSPEEINNLNYDKIMICSVAYDVIKKQLLDMGILEEHIVDKSYFHLKRFIKKYTNDEKYRNNPEIRNIVAYVKKRGWHIFNYNFNDEYTDYPVDVFFDKENGLYYANYKGKRMYMSRHYSDKKEVEEYVRGLAKEQDRRSPHCYLTDDFFVPQNGIVVDAGVAEGNFALDIIDYVKKIYLIEMDEQWIEALQYTFEDYKDKVVIIKGCLSDKNEGEGITLDAIIKNEKIDFIKMDIEGFEVPALNGAAKVLKNNNVKLDVCAYHNIDDEDKIKNILNSYGYQTVCSDGYMVFFASNDFQSVEPVKLVRGLVRGWKL